MNFSLDHACLILQQTPGTIRHLLQDLPASFAQQNEGAGTWSVFDVVGHLVEGEKTDWIPRTRIILGEGDRSFQPFDRFAQLKNNRGKSLSVLLDQFERLRLENMRQLEQFEITVADLHKTGIHPEFGTVTLEQLLATWVVHDLNHLAQVSRILASQYREAVGPWTAYLRILQT